jgi:hypothetical protein
LNLKKYLSLSRILSGNIPKRAGALQCLQDYKAKGVLRAIGISTHAVEVVRRAAEIKEIDIIFPIINKLGIGIVGGSVEDMIKAISEAHKAGKGLYAMKALGGGHLIDQLEEAFNFVRNIKGISSLAVGMVSPEELELNIKIFNDETAKLITPLGLLFWYMDDGTLAHKEWINLSTNNFSFEENTIIATMFKKNFGIDAKIYLIKSQQRYYIRLNKESTRRFMSLLKPFKKFIPPSMSYKFTFLRQAS